MAEYAFQTKGLVKRFGKTTALAGVDLRARQGTVLGVLGPNGAGKTTTIRVLATLTGFDEGAAHVGGFDVVRDAAKVRRLIGLTGQYATLDEELTGLANLVLIGRLLDLRRPDAVRRAEELLDRFGLAESARRPVATYSGGMRRRLDLAASLVGRPSMVFLDEPSAGLDPGRREQLWGIIRELTADGASVLLTTQYLEEADALADEIAVIDNGRVIAHGTPPELKRVAGGRTIAVRPRDPGRAGDVAHILAEVTGNAVERTRRELVVPVTGTDSAVFEVARRLERQGIAPAEFSLRLPSLDDVFFALTGEPGTDPTEKTDPTEQTDTTEKGRA
ncbi:ABC transporter [Prauserella marina]|uniref:Oleandomycin transport system ATP-binding protein n=1 Tax=Prauserella marina TaxID=530584 RepID=A0A222VZU7_9PSEU|nr:ATP-binding cassette domain-containing protein [Prauserella marina]ASR39449.1 ABC transporter [Prauserella marina]PWV80342.1 oleandomycin transport system ATP-binding protein [Prauserella marina]SDD52197.1 oleandomycin transport system ATP-binding protein [Prauserella marina]